MGMLNVLKKKRQMKTQRGKLAKISRVFRGKIKKEREMDVDG